MVLLIFNLSKGILFLSFKIYCFHCSLLQSQVLENLKRICTMLLQKIKKFLLDVIKAFVFSFELVDASLLGGDENSIQELFSTWPAVGVLGEHASYGL